MQVCSTANVFHALLNTGDEIIDSILTNGLRPFPNLKLDTRLRLELKCNLFY